MARNYSSISEVKTLAANVPLPPGAGSTQVILNEGTTGLPAVPFVLVLNPDTSEEEVVLATALTGSTYTITRNIEGGGLKTHTAGQEVRHMIVGSDLQLVHNHLDNTTTAHGVSGEVVGTTNAQILTLKTLTTPTLNTPKINENVALTATSTELNVLDGITASTTELNYTDGVTSAIQTQIDTKAPSAGPTFTGTVVLPSTTSIGTVSATELGYVDGVTSAIQTQLNALTSSIASIVTVPTGVISPYAGLDSNIPTGYLLCNGQEVSASTYSALKDVITTTYGAYTNGSGGVGTTHFRLPDLRGRAPIGAGTGTGLTARALGATVGAETHTLTIAQIPDHTHIGPLFFNATPGTGTSGATSNSGSPTSNRPSTDGVNGTTGGAHPNMQPSLAINFIIKH
jgi:microcystin-dependent protein